MRKILSLLMVLSLVLTGVLTACGANQGGEEPAPNNDQGQGAGAPANEDMLVAMVTDVGGVDDNSFNQSAWEGLQQLKKDAGVKVEYLQSKKATDYEPNLNEFVYGGANLVWGIGYKMEKDVRKVAEANPDARLGIVDFSWGEETPENVAAVVFREEEGSFLVGVIAAKMTKTNKVGFLGGAEFDLIKKFEYGFKAGVASVNPDIEVVSNYVGAFDKPDEGKNFASTMYGQGVDIIYHASGQTGDGVFTEAKQRRANGETVWVIGVDKDQSFLGPEVTLTSMVKRVDNAVYSISQQLIEGNFPGGQTVAYGLADDGVGIAETSDKNVPADVLELVNEYKQKIVAGEIQVPATAEAFDQFKANLGK